MTVLEILNQYGFATLASIGMGWLKTDFFHI